MGLQGSRIGPDRSAGLLSAAGIVTTALATLNYGWSARMIANNTKDIKGVKVHWASVSAPGQVTVRIETDDGGGKPSGTLYDANAVLTGQVPAAGVQSFTFAVLPTTARTVGTAYHLVIETTTGGTTQTLSSHLIPTNPANYPANALTSTDGTTYTAVTNAIPICSLVYDDDTEGASLEGLYPYYTTANNNIYGTNAAAIELTTQGTLTVNGIDCACLDIAGTPAGDLRVRIFDSGNNTVANSTLTLDKDMFVSGKGFIAYYGSGSEPTLTAGTYKIVLDSSASANSSNCFNVKRVTPLSTAAVTWMGTPNSTSDVTATPIVWTATSGSAIPLGLRISAITGGGSTYVGVVGG